MRCAPGRFWHLPFAAGRQRKSTLIFAVAGNQFSQTYCSTTSITACQPINNGVNDININVTINAGNPESVVNYNSCPDNGHNIPYCFTPLNSNGTLGVTFNPCVANCTTNCISKLPCYGCPYPGPATGGTSSGPGNPCAGCLIAATGFQNLILAEQSQNKPDTNLISYYRSQVNYNVDDYIRSWLDINYDSLPSAMDSVIATMNNFGIPGANYEITKAYLAKGDTIKANQCLIQLNQLKGQPASQSL